MREGMREGRKRDEGVVHRYFGGIYALKETAGVAPATSVNEALGCSLKYSVERKPCTWDQGPLSLVSDSWSRLRTKRRRVVIPTRYWILHTWSILGYTVSAIRYTAVILPGCLWMIYAFR